MDVAWESMSGTGIEMRLKELLKDEEFRETVGVLLAKIFYEMANSVRVLVKKYNMTPAEASCILGILLASFRRYMKEELRKEIEEILSKIVDS